MTDSEVPTKDFDLKNPVHFLALGFGSGLLKPAPGTWGTLAAIPVYYLLTLLPMSSLVHPNLYYWIATALICIAGFYICGKAATDAGVHDHKSIVWDEIGGFLITMAIVPVVHIVWVAAGFVLFRFFDIVKPFPIGWIDKKIGGGFGIMLDDILAGFYAMGVLHLAMGWYLSSAIQG